MERAFVRVYTSAWRYLDYSQISALYHRLFFLLVVLLLLYCRSGQTHVLYRSQIYSGFKENSQQARWVKSKTMKKQDVKINTNI